VEEHSNSLPREIACDKQSRGGVKREVQEDAENLNGRQRGNV
jgi:hypothetical protein